MEGLIFLCRGTESQFDSGVWSESVASSEPLTEETEKADQLINKLNSLGQNLNTAAITSRPPSQVAASSCPPADPEDVQMKELLLGKLAKYRAANRV